MSFNFIKIRFVSFRHAIAGIKYILTTQKNSWIHSAFTVMVICFGIYLKIELLNWAILALTIGMVWVAEAINTSIETILDLVSPEYHNLAKIGKDVSAGAVLIASIISVIVGVITLFDPLIKTIIK
jgi:diacylglycerol kinase